MARPHVERALVRVLVGATLALAVWACAWVPIPQDAQGDPDLPTLAFGQASLYRLEVALLVFYGGLLLFTPAFSGLARGRLPIEISARGAKFADEVDQSTEVNEVAIEEVRKRLDELFRELTEAWVEIGHLKERE
jgi:hypothetical protein